MHGGAQKGRREGSWRGREARKHSNVRKRQGETERAVRLHFMGIVYFLYS